MGKSVSLARYRFSLGTGLTIVALVSSVLTAVPGPAFAESSNSDGSISVSRDGTRAKVTWKVRDSNREASLYRDGVLLAKHAGGGYTEDSIDNLQSVSYVLDLSHPLTTSDIADIANPALRAKVEESPQLYSAVDIVGVTIGPSGSQNAASASSSASSTLFRYQSFIKDAVIPVTSAAQLGCTNGAVPIGSSDYFLGDNRSYAPSPMPNSYSPAYRTRFDVLVDWSQRTVSALPSVGVTNLVHVSSDSLAGTYSKNPDKSSMVLGPNTNNGASARFALDQDVRDPFCLSNGIWVSIIVNIGRAGSYSISGSRIQVPNQEVYIKDSDASTWTPILKSPPLSMDCLNPPIAVILGCVTQMSLSGSR